MPRQRRAMSEINVVPYIDVMLVLLVIFMITAPLVNPGVIELPTVGKSSLPPELRELLETVLPALLIALGFQVILSSFFLSLLGMPKRR